MHDDGTAVATTRWLCHATPGAIGQTTEAICVFAGRHGTQAPMLEGVTAAVTEALDEIFDADSARCAGGPDTVVDAAADGTWLTVRLEGPGRWPAVATETHLRVLADRVELSVDEHDDVTVLFEFPSDIARTDEREVRMARGSRPAFATETHPRILADGVELSADEYDDMFAFPLDSARPSACDAQLRRRRAPRGRAVTRMLRPR